ncbi:MAG: hypothetical protein K2G89_07990 [Lachnospiraceae bacterium]|nr:hypothetical protein [Lachnospiraceae bacterium]
MEKNKKIIVLKAREFIYTMIFAALVILLIVTIVWMFSSKSETNEQADAVYQPGIYTAGVDIGSASLNVEVTVDACNITHVGLVNTDESITTMYPLIHTSLDEINAQLPNIQSPDELTFSSENQYTTVIIKQAIAAALEKAALK